MKNHLRCLIGTIILLLLTLIFSSTITANSLVSEVPCQVSNSTIALTITDGTVEYGILSPDTTQDTIALGQTQSVRNTGDETVTFNIKSGDALHTVSGGTDWTLGAPRGQDQFTHEFKTGVLGWTELNTSDTQLASGIGPNNTVTLDLRIGMPTEITDYQQHTITVTITAVSP